MRQPHRVFHRGAIAAGLSLLAFYAATNLAPASVADVLDNTAQLIAPLLAGAACLVAARRATERRAWRFLAASSFAWAAGQVVWMAYEVVLRRDVPSVSVADIGFLAAIPLAWAGLVSFPSIKSSSRVRSVLEGLIVAGSCVFLTWSIAIGPIVRSTPLGSFAAWVDLAYPLGDVVTIVLVVLALAQARPERRSSIGLVTAGMALMAVADVSFALLELHNVYSTGSLIDGLWVASFLMIGLGGLHSAQQKAEMAGATQRRQQRDWLLYLPVALTIVTALAMELRDGVVEPVLVFVGIAIASVLVAHQYLTLRENRILNTVLGDRLRELEQSRALQDEFVASVSHELRTPVTTLVGAARTLLRPELGLSQHQRLLVEALDRASGRMSQLIEDLIIAAGLGERISLARSPFDLSARMRATALNFAPANKSFDVHVSDGLIALGDAEWFGEMVGQLLTNADRFAPDGTTVTLSARAKGDTISVEVRDEGPGIAKADRSKLFQRFSKLESGMDKAGVGLGLYIARRLAESMGATVALAEKDGPGATFIVTIPALPASVLPATPAEAV